jgi:nucleoside-diphosphate-sugar epimerase
LKTIAITGANGLVGCVLVDYFINTGFKVLCLQRSKPKVLRENQHWREYHLEDEVLPEWGQDIDVLIHCALSEYSSRNEDSDSINLSAAKVILDAHKKYQFKIIFISTFSAHEEALSHYGKNKLTIENLFLKSKATIFRLGLVVSKGGLLEEIFSLVRDMPLLPIIGAGKEPIQLLSEKQLCAFAGKGVEGSLPSQIFHLGNEQPITMDELYAEASLVLKKKPFKIRIPLAAIEILVFFAEKMRISLPVSRETILGLRAIRYIDTRDVFKEQSVEPEDPTEQVRKLYLDLSKNIRAE